MNGQLQPKGTFNLGRTKYHYVFCVSCHTEFPCLECMPYCNGKMIVACPYCASEQDNREALTTFRLTGELP